MSKDNYNEPSQGRREQATQYVIFDESFLPLNVGWRNEEAVRLLHREDGSEKTQ